MPRGPRLDAPGGVHHGIVRGIERWRIFRFDFDRRRCLDRLGATIVAGGGGLYAWCLMPKHVHALIRTGTMPLRPAHRVRAIPRSCPPMASPSR